MTNKMNYLQILKHRLCLILISSSLISVPTQATELDGHECLIEPMVTAKVGSQVQGVVDQLLVDRSDMVTTGQPIAILKSTLEQANLAQAEARANMHGEINARKADLNLAQLNRERIKTLYAKNLVSAQERDEGVAQLQVASAALRQAQDNLLVLQHDLARSQALLEQRIVRSPIDGAVVERHTFPGEFIYDAPVMTIAQLDPLRIEVVLPAKLFGQFNKGDKALVYPEIIRDEPLLATVHVVDRQLDTFSGTFGVRLTLPNTDLSITSGQKCRISFAPTDGKVATHSE